MVDTHERTPPDLFAYGKVIGGGYPLAALAGSAEVMDLLAPAGSVYQAGTLSGNPVAATAGLTTLQNLTADSYARLDATAQRVLALASDALKAAGVAHSAQQAGNLISIFFTEGPVKSMDDASQQNEKAFARFFNGMLNRGVSLPPSAYEAWFVSTAHDEEANVMQRPHRRRRSGYVTDLNLLFAGGNGDTSRDSSFLSIGSRPRFTLCSVS